MERIACSPLPPPAAAGPHSGEPHRGDISGRLNWLRAGVLGANDGIVSVGSLLGTSGVV